MDQPREREQPEIEPSAAPRPRYWLHGLLLVTTFGTTTLAGLWEFGEGLRGALAYSLPLMAILIAHEMGHFIAAKIHGVPASLPYFIPLPTMPGTLGAVIGMRGGTSSRRKLLDIGAAGPLAGLAVAIPVLLYGIHTSQVVSLAGAEPGSMVLTEGNSILYLVAKYAIKGAWLPANGIDLVMNPTCMAGWFGLFVTALNLLPIGQLDGGHVVAAFLGGDRHEGWSRRLHRALPLMGLAVALYIAVGALLHGDGLGASAWYGLYSGAPWVVWFLLLFGLKRLSRGRYHPPLDEEPLGAGRRAFVFVVGVVYVAIFMPYVFRIGPPG